MPPVPLPLSSAVGLATDAELVEVVRQRGEDAGAHEAELCRRFGPRARLYGLRHLRDGDQARDLVQAVLVVLLESARGGRIREPEHVDRFVLGACRNVVARMRENDARAINLGPAEGEVAGVMPTFDHLDVEVLFRCIAGLDLRSRVVVRMCFQEEASADEIGVALGTTAGNVRVLRHRAIAALRACLDGQREARP